jgi:hypothetical protein
MATPLVALGRIEFKYLLSGFQHVTKLYCGIVTIGTGGASTILDRDGVTLHTLNQVVTVAAPVLDAVSPDDNALYSAVLQTRSGSIWTDVDFFTHATGIGVINAKGWQSTFVFRAGDLTKIKCVLMEGAPGVLSHTASPTGGSTVVNALIANMTSGISSTHNMFRWVQGRSGDNVALTGGFVGFTSSGNRKIRRARGLT